jgi:8-oxo-dGTP diphosphatase
MAYSYPYPHPAVTVDIAVFTVVEGEWQVLLIRRDQEPFEGLWALPGGFVGIDEELEQAARRELLEETGVEAALLEQVGAFGRPDRDPRERVISIAYLTLVSYQRLDTRAGSDAAEVRLFSVDELPQLAFDHADILALARQRLSGRREAPSA